METIEDTEVTVYDIGDKSFSDRYTVVLHEWEANPGKVAMLGFNENPTHPQYGISQFDEGVEGDHLGKKISFDALALHLQKHVQRRLK